MPFTSTISAQVIRDENQLPLLLLLPFNLAQILKNAQSRLSTGPLPPPGAQITDPSLSAKGDIAILDLDRFPLLLLWPVAMASCSIATSLSRLSLLRLIPKPSSSYSSSIPLFPTTTRKDPSRFRLFSASMASEPKESPSNNQGLHSSPDEATKGYFMQQTMYRIKDPKASLDFYSRVLGMSLLKRLDFPEMKFSLYFMGYEDTASAPSNETERTVWTFSQKATIELTHNWGTESDPDFKGYHNGNSEPRGFGHIGITVDDTYKACERFERLGVEFVKKPDDGKMKGIAFIKDPDGYWIEIFDLRRIGTVSTTAA